MDSLTVLIIAGAAAAGFVQGLSGFAFALVAASVWAWAVPPQLIAPMLVFGALVGQLVAAPSMLKAFSLKAAAPFVLGGWLGVPIGVAILPHVEPVWFKFGVGLFLVTYCPILLIAARLPKLETRSTVGDGAVGMTGGVLGGIAGMAGSLPTLWCLVTGRERHESRAILQVFNIAMHSATLSGYALTGTLDAEAAGWFLVVAPAMLVPTLIGARLYHRISDQAFRRVLLVLLTVSGLMLLVGSVPVLLRA